MRTRIYTDLIHTIILEKKEDTDMLLALIICTLPFTMWGMSGTFNHTSERNLRQLDDIKSWHQTCDAVRAYWDRQRLKPAPRLCPCMMTTWD
jgi:hypothetical protein